MNRAEIQLQRKREREIMTAKEKINEMIGSCIEKLEDLQDTESIIDLLKDIECEVEALPDEDERY